MFWKYDFEATQVRMFTIDGVFKTNQLKIFDIKDYSKRAQIEKRTKIIEN